MALVRCYDQQGNARMKEAVDARECVEFCGFKMEPPEAAKEASPEETDKDPKSKTGRKG